MYVFVILTVEKNNKERRVNMLVYIKLLKIMIDLYVTIFVFKTLQHCGFINLNVVLDFIILSSRYVYL